MVKPDRNLSERILEGMKCPVCNNEIKNDDQRLCEGCGWEFDRYVTELSSRERELYDQKLGLARKNWKELLQAREDVARLKKDVERFEKNVKMLEKELEQERENSRQVMQEVSDLFQAREDELFDQLFEQELKNLRQDKNCFDPETGMELVFVKGGCYEMGCGSWTSDCIDDEKPVHTVCLDDFYIGKYPVTQGQWKKVMGNNPAEFQKGDNYPVENVSWDDAQEFIKRLNRQSLGRKYRLPTEAEWEYAARSGGRKEKYAGGDDIDHVAWYGKKSGNHTHPVGQKAPNCLCIYDMSGNIWEWCQDWYDEDYYSNSPRNNPAGPSSGTYRVARGGGWVSGPKYVCSTFRGGFRPSNRFDYVGFRLALS